MGIIHSKLSSTVPPKITGTDWDGDHTAGGTAIDLGAATLLTRRTVTNAEDDLFDAGSLDGKWTANGGTGSWTFGTYPGWVLGNGGFLVQPVSAGNWTIETECLMPASTQAEYTGIGLFFATSSTPSTAGNARVLSVGRNNNGIRDWRVFGDNYVNGAFSSQIFSSDAAAMGVETRFFLRIVRVSSSSYRFELSSTGKGDWQAWHAWDPGITPTHFGILGSGYFNSFHRY